MGEFFAFIREKFFGTRVKVIVAVFLLFSVILICRLYYLQIIRGEEYQSNYNLLTEKSELLPATRGNIYDREGRLLAYNRLSYNVTIEDDGTYTSLKQKNEILNAELYDIIMNLERCGNEIDNSFGISYDEDTGYSFVSSGTSELRFRADIFGHAKVHDLAYNSRIGLDEATCTAEEIMDYLYSSRKFGISDEYDELMRYKICVVRYQMSLYSYQKYIATTIATDVNAETVAYIKENSADFTGINVEEDSMRQYNYAECMSNIVGYTGTISSEEYQNLIAKDPDNADRYSLTDVVGKGGIEQYLNTELSGTKGKETVYVDHVGNQIEVFDHIDPISGNGIYLSIDAELQQSVYTLLEQEIAGIVYSKLANIKEYTVSSEGSASDILIPIYDAYVSLIKNGILSVDRMNDDDATPLEHEVYNALQQKKEETLNALSDSLITVNPVAYKDLPEEYQDYATFIIKYLKSSGIIITDKIDEADNTQKRWENMELSVEDYLKYLISVDWIDITAYQKNQKYSDSEEMYRSLAQYIIEQLRKDRSFDNLIYEYAVREDVVSGNQLCAILYDQGVLAPDEELRNSLASGERDPYYFIKEKLKNLELTPGQLALDPCSGSCVIIDPRNGSVLACVSYPGYDTNRLANHVDREYFTYLNFSGSSPMYNHATQQETAPGSTFKIVSATAGLSEGAIATDTIIEDMGLFDKVSNKPRCWIYPSNHGEENVTDAIRDSCNYFFYEVGWRLAGGTNYNDRNGIAKIQKYASLYGLDRKTGIEIEESLPHVATQYPVMAAIGQSDNDYTTISLARYAAAVSNSGTVFTLSLLDHMTDSDGNTIENYGSTVESNIDVLNTEQWDAIHTGMRQVVEEYDGFDDFPIAVAGKTGTAQESRKRPNHALFISYAPYEAPQYSLCVRIPFGYTSHNAADVAKSILGVCFDLEEYNALVGTGATELSTNNRRSD